MAFREKQFDPSSEQYKMETAWNIENDQDVDQAARIIANGGVVAVEFPGTGGLIYDASNPNAVRKAMEIKAGMHRKNNPTPPREIQKTTSLLLSLEDIAPIIDMETLDHPEDAQLRAFFYKGELRKQKTFQNYPEQPTTPTPPNKYSSFFNLLRGKVNELGIKTKAPIEELTTESRPHAGDLSQSTQENVEREAARLESFGYGINFKRFREKIGGLIFLKLAVHTDARINGVPLPEWAYSKAELTTESGKNKEVHYVHVLNFDYDPAIKKLVRALHTVDVPNAVDGTRGIRMIGVTSMNYSGIPEVVDADKEKEFADENRLPFVENANARNVGLIGSYTIFNPAEKMLERHGNIDQKIVEQAMVNRQIGTRGREANYPAVQLPEAIIAHVFAKVSSTEKIEVLNQYKILHDKGLDDMTIEEELIRQFIEH